MIRVPGSQTKAEILAYIKANPGRHYRQIDHAIGHGEIRDYLAEFCEAGTIYYKTIKNPDTGHKIRTYYLEE